MKLSSLTVSRIEKVKNSLFVCVCVCERERERERMRIREDPGEGALRQSDKRFK